MAGKGSAVAASMLADLPTTGRGNFSKLGKCKPKRAKKYLPTRSTAPPPDQVLNGEEDNLLLRFLHQGLERHQGGQEPRGRPARDSQKEQRRKKRGCEAQLQQAGAEEAGSASPRCPRGPGGDLRDVEEGKKVAPCGKTVKMQRLDCTTTATTTTTTATGAGTDTTAGGRCGGRGQGKGRRKRKPDGACARGSPTMDVDEGACCAEGGRAPRDSGMDTS